MKNKKRQTQYKKTNDPINMNARQNTYPHTTKENKNNDLSTTKKTQHDKHKMNEQKK